MLEQSRSSEFESGPEGGRSESIENRENTAVVCSFFRVPADFSAAT
jgi:hypothetical protein